MIKELSHKEAQEKTREKGQGEYLVTHTQPNRKERRKKAQEILRWAKREARRELKELHPFQPHIFGWRYKIRNNILPRFQGPRHLRKES